MSKTIVCLWTSGDEIVSSISIVIYREAVVDPDAPDCLTPGHTVEIPVGEIDGVPHVVRVLLTPEDT